MEVLLQLSIRLNFIYLIVAIYFVKTKKNKNFFLKTELPFLMGQANIKKDTED